jgi:hypothetical protein
MMHGSPLLSLENASSVLELVAVPSQHVYKLSTPPSVSLRSSFFMSIPKTFTTTDMTSPASAFKMTQDSAV